MVQIMDEPTNPSLFLSYHIYIFFTSHFPPSFFFYNLFPFYLCHIHHRFISSILSTISIFQTHLSFLISSFFIPFSFTFHLSPFIVSLDHLYFFHLTKNEWRHKYYLLLISKKILFIFFIFSLYFFFLEMYICWSYEKVLFLLIVIFCVLKLANTIFDLHECMILIILIIQKNLLSLFIYFIYILILLDKNNFTCFNHSIRLFIIKTLLLMITYNFFQLFDSQLKIESNYHYKMTYMSNIELLYAMELFYRIFF